MMGPLFSSRLRFLHVDAGSDGFCSTTPTTANLTRSRPEAYLIPRAWTDVATRFEIFGLEVEELPEAFSSTVEVLNVKSTVLESSYYGGVVRVELTTDAFEKDIELPPGTFWVSTRQKNAALAFMALKVSYSFELLTRNNTNITLLLSWRTPIHLRHFTSSLWSRGTSILFSALSTDSWGRPLLALKE